MTAGTVVVGAGQAAAELASALRDRGYEKPITIVGDEPYAPYQRPPLSKAFLAGSADLETLMLNSDQFYADKNISLLTGERVIRIELAAGHGDMAGRVVTDNGEGINFEHLVFAVGAEPRRLSVPGSDLAGIVYMRDIADAELFKKELETARRVVVVGGGFIGLEAASAVRAQGKDVTVLEASERLIGRVVAPVVSEFYRHAHMRRGVTVDLNAQVTALNGANGRVSSVTLADGRDIVADLVIVGIGVIPRTALAQSVGVVCEGGIIVDDCARTSHPAILAIGDCTVAPHKQANGAMLRLESVPHAIEQARCAAAAIVGVDEPYKAVPWFWSDQGNIKLQIAGLSKGYDRLHVSGDPSAEKFAVFYIRDEKVVAVDAINSPRDFAAVRRALNAGADYELPVSHPLAHQPTSIG